MQLMIDTQASSGHELVTAAAFLLAAANNDEARTMLRAIKAVQAGADFVAAPPAPIVPSGTVAAPPAPPAPPFVPPAPPSAATVPAASIASTTTSVSPPVPPPPPPASIATAAAPSPEVPTTAVAVVAANVQLDKRGFPHDARIHSATPSINKSDDLWRTKRGVDNALIETVEAELRSKGYGVVASAPTVPAAPPAPPAPTVTVPAAPPIPAPPAGVVAAPNAPAPTVMVPPPPPIPSGLPSGDGQGSGAAVDMFRVLMGKLKGHTGESGALRREVLQPIYTEFGVSGPQDFHKKREQIPAFLARIEPLLGV